LDFLSSIKVLQVGTGVAGRWAGTVLRDLGAQVFEVRPAERAPEAMRASSGGDIESAAVMDALLGGKPLLDVSGLDEAWRRCSGFDIVICDRVCEVPAVVPAELGEYQRRVARFPDCVWVSISAFGLSGPRAGDLASNLTISAAAGVLAYVREGEGEEPRPLPGLQALLAAGQAAALAALHGLDRRAKTAERVHVDVSAQESMLATGPVLHCADKLFNFGRPKRFTAPFGVFACADGVVHIAALENHHWAGVARVIEAPAWAHEIRTWEAREANSERIYDLVRTWASARNKADCQSALQAAGVPATAGNAMDELLGSPQFRHREQWDEVAIGSQQALAMASPISGDVRPASGSDRGRGTSLADVTVADASHVVAASLAGALLGAMGARVIKIEDPDRVDLYRRNGPFIDGHRDPEWSGYFAIMNHSKESMLCSSQEQLDRLLALADVVLENWGTARAVRAGIDSRSIGERWPEKLAVSCSGFGHSGPLKDYRVYAYNLNGYCGLTWLLTAKSGALPRLNFAWPDFLSAYVLATGIAAWAIGGASKPEVSRRGASLDISMAEVVVNRLNELVVRSQLGQDKDNGLGMINGRGGSYVLATDGGAHHVAITVPPELECELLRVLAEENPVEAGEIAQADASPALDVLSALADGASAASLTHKLRLAGIDGCVVMAAEDLIVDDHLLDRGFFAPVTHEEWGTRRLVGLPWRFVGEGPVPLRPPPRVGSFELPAERDLTGDVPLSADEDAHDASARNTGA
jgi:crotonobetainyl-CoA:carnitine CoA-transferase CaiB-like acyl-CoA transferase